MTVPGVSLMTATTFIAAVGDIERFPDPRKLVSYLGLDPKVRQSGNSPARHGRISKHGAAQTRQILTEAAFVAVSTAGPMRAFYERVRVRRGSQIAIVAVARKLAVLFWHLLTREQDDACALELRIGAPRHPGSRALATKNSLSQRAQRERERELSEHAELAYRRLSPTGPPAAGRRWARARHRGAHLNGPRRADPRDRLNKAPKDCSSLRQSPAPNHHDLKAACNQPEHLTSSSSTSTTSRPRGPETAHTNPRAARISPSPTEPNSDGNPPIGAPRGNYATATAQPAPEQ
jgi:hypothetical protein